MYDAQIFGEKNVTRIAAGERAHGFEQTWAGDRLRFKGAGIANQNLGIVGNMKMTLLALHVDGACLLYHSVVIVNALNSKRILQTTLEFRR